MKRCKQKPMRNGVSVNANDCVCMRAHLFRFESDNDFFLFTKRMDFSSSLLSIRLVYFSICMCV